VQSDGRVKGAVVEGQVHRVAADEAHLLAEPGALGQAPGDIHELRGEVDPGDVAAALGGDEPSRAAEAAADVQNAIAGRRAQRRDHLARGGEAARVKLIDRGEL
jgi:hypothetical protein